MSKPQAHANTRTTSRKTITTTSGLKYIDSVIRKGTFPKASDTVIVHDTGWLTNGKKLDQPGDRHQPFAFVLGRGQLIKCRDEGSASMPVDGKRKVQAGKNRHICYNARIRMPLMRLSATVDPR